VSARGQISGIKEVAGVSREGARIGNTVDYCIFRRRPVEGHCTVVILAHSSVTLMKGSSLSYQ